MTIFGEGFYCCLCFNAITPADCSITKDGHLEDVCHKCAQEELEYLANHLLHD